jgi:SAM-dependent methyltransferase
LEPAEYEYMFRLEDAFWWYVGMRRICAALLADALTCKTGLQVLDAGAGTGGSLQLLERYGQVSAFDFAAEATRMFLQRRRGRVCQASIDAIPFRDNTFDLVTSFEVLCQLSEDQARTALLELRRVLRPGGLLVLRLPAFQALYGPHDVAVHTRHRYSAPEVERELQESGFARVRTTYANTLLFPAALARRLLARFVTPAKGDSDVRPVPGPLNALLTAILSTEAPIVRRLRLPFGLSVIALAAKP